MGRRNPSPLQVGSVRRGLTSGCLGPRMFHNQCVPSITPSPIRFSKIILPDIFYITQRWQSQDSKSSVTRRARALKHSAPLFTLSREIQHAVLQTATTGPSALPRWHVIAGALAHDLAPSPSGGISPQWLHLFPTSLSCC